MSDRPDPDDLLKRVQEQESKQQRGKLKIFFGAAPGVGKTYAMLQAARDKAKEGLDVVLGYVQPHARPETLGLVLGLDLLARRLVEYKGATLQEFDLAAALARRPRLIIVDELAHTNAPSPGAVTHTKRWRDVQELLDAGIDVYTTLNVQHLESLNDVVARITGVTVRETVPDSFFDTADEVELVDLPPDDLLERLGEGKVYVAQQARLATENFFKKGNLIALRELALRRTAERVNAQMQDWRHEHAVAGTWPTGERLLVCVGPSPSSARLIRAARRMAASLKAPWVALHVQTGAAGQMSDADRDRLAVNLRLAEQLGGEPVMLTGTDSVEEILRYAQKRNASKIIVGKPREPRWREWFGRPFVYELTRRSGDIDVYVISGDADEPPATRQLTAPERTALLPYIWAVAIVVACTALTWLLWGRVAESNLVMIYLLGVVAAALRFGRGPASLAAVLGVASFDFFLVPPHFTFAVSDVEYLFTFAVMLATGLVISTLMARVRVQAESARQREQRMAALYAMSKQLATLETREDITRAAVRHIGESLESQVLILLPNSEGAFQTFGIDQADTLSDHELAVARWVLEHDEKAGQGTETLAGADALYLPLATTTGALGVVRVKSLQPKALLRTDQLEMLEAFVSLTASALARVDWAATTERARLEIETERLRNSLLSAVSHDLRTPLTAIAGASSTLLETGDDLDPTTRRELIEGVYEEAERLDRLVTNLLDMTRLEQGSISIRREWQPLIELVGVALSRLTRQLKDHPVSTMVSGDLPLVYVDGMLVQQVLVNLIENAAKYSPPEAPIELSVSMEPEPVTIEVADRGPGLPQGDEQKVFQRFYRSPTTAGRSGVGLGLTICRGIVELHGGRIWAENRADGGIAFRFVLPVTGQPPEVELDEPSATSPVAASTSGTAT